MKRAYFNTEKVAVTFANGIRTFKNNVHLSKCMKHNLKIGYIVIWQPL